MRPSREASVCFLTSCLAPTHLPPPWQALTVGGFSLSSLNKEWSLGWEIWGMEEHCQ